MIRFYDTVWFFGGGRFFCFRVFRLCLRVYAMIFPYQIDGGLSNGRETLDGEVKSMGENLCEIP